jgi:hypothetical protein
MTELKTIELNNDTRICSFDIEKTYTNIPKKDIINISSSILDNNAEIQSNICKEIIYILKTVMKQNYFQFDQKYYKQMEGLAMGAPILAVLAETFIQHMEYKYICHSYILW